VTASDSPLTRGRAEGAAAPGASLPGASISSVLLAAWIGWQMGWAWAAAGIVAILVHELGHLVAINLLGCGPGRIHFIPFLGGAATMTRAPDTEFKGVLIAVAGPLAGLLAAIPFIFIYEQTEERLWLGGIYFIGMINLINLAPAPPLDGSKALGPALARIHPWLERGALFLVGLAAVAWAVWTRSYLFGILVGLSAVSTLRLRAMRPEAVRLNLVQWLASVGLWMVALALCLMVVSYGAKGALVL
jgi:Zn-dependent protease